MKKKVLIILLIVCAVKMISAGDRVKVTGALGSFRPKDERLKTFYGKGMVYGFNCSYRLIKHLSVWGSYENTSQSGVTSLFKKLP